jgi:hypothetical protein
MRLRLAAAGCGIASARPGAARTKDVAAAASAA